MSKYISYLNSIPMLWISGLFLLASFITEYILPLLGSNFSFAINPAWVSLFISGIPLAYLAIRNTMQGRITSPLLITIAMIAAVYIDDIFAAGEVAFIMGICEWLEDRTIEKAKKGIEILLNLVPSTGRRISITDNGENKEEIVNAENIKIDDILRIFPGESFPADGIIIEGNTSIDQSIMTGESLPVDKIEGDEVFAGTINRFGSVDIRVTKSFANSSLQKMIKLIEDAENNKAPMQRTVDRWAAYIVPAACIISIVTYLVFRFFYNMPNEALLRAVTILVVFCPCALALATPTSIMAAIGQATKNGVLIKSGEALEKMGEISTVAFDKTGTLTHGKLSVSDIVNVSQFDDAQFISLLASAESRSEHPIAKAIMQYAKEQNVQIANIKNFAMAVGMGVFASIDGKIIYCGNEKLISSKTSIVLNEEMRAKLNKLSEEGKASILVAEENQLLGLVGLSDTIKDNAKASILDLEKAGINKTVLLTGDNEKSANYISSQVGIKSVYSSLLPEDKVQAVKELSQNDNQVCMVGDGVNDAPALKTASVGIAMGTMGSDIAIDAADIAILGDDITKISYIKKLSNATLFSIKFNITLSMVINFVAIILSVKGWLNPATGALVHNAGSVLVVLNAARLYEKKII